MTGVTRLGTSINSRLPINRAHCVRMTIKAMLQMVGHLSQQLVSNHHCLTLTVTFENTDNIQDHLGCELTSLQKRARSTRQTSQPEDKHTIPGNLTNASLSTAIPPRESLGQSQIPTCPLESVRAACLPVTSIGALGARLALLCACVAAVCILCGKKKPMSVSFSLAGLSLEERITLTQS